MSAVVWKLGVLVAAVAMAAATVQYTRALQSALEVETLVANDARAAVLARDRVIDRLQADAQDTVRHRQQLDAKHTDIGAKLARINEALRKMKDADTVYRHWADSPLPPAVVHLHSHRALAGVDDYFSNVLERERMPVSGDATSDE